MLLDLKDMEVTVAALTEEFASTSATVDENAALPTENIRRLAETGLLAAAFPRAQGGRGIGLTKANRIVNTIARGEPSTALLLTQQYLFQMQLFRDLDCSEVLRSHIARTVIADGGLMNMLRVEPQLGSPIRGGLPETAARKVQGGWRISGHKIYATGCEALRFMGVWARTDEGDPRVGIWIIPMPSDGIAIHRTWRHLGMRASGSHDVVFDEVFVPDDHAIDLRPPSRWSVRDPVHSAWSNVLFSTIYDGVAQAARDWLITFLRERKPSNLGAALATLPRMQEGVGLIDALLHTNRTLLEKMAHQTDVGALPSSIEAAYAKMTVTNNAIEAVAKALELCGNPGLSRDNPLERHHRNVLCARIHSPQNDMILIAGGRAALGLAS